jgi:hypothetical protein
MANDRLAYNPTAGGSGTGYAAWTGTSNIAVPASGWTTEAGGFSWWMSPDYSATVGIIGRTDPTEERGVGPWTWNFDTATVPGSILSGEIGCDSGKFSPTTTQIFISSRTYTDVGNGIFNVLNGASLPGQIYVMGVGQAPPYKLAYTLNSITLNSGPQVHTLNVTYVSSPGGINHVNVQGEDVAISTRSTVTPTTSRSRGTFSFFRSDITNVPATAALAVRLGIPGVNAGSTLAQIKTAAQGSSNFWVSW